MSSLPLLSSSDDESYEDDSLCGDAEQPTKRPRTETQNFRALDEKATYYRDLAKKREKEIEAYALAKREDSEDGFQGDELHVDNQIPRARDIISEESYSDSVSTSSGDYDAEDLRSRLLLHAKTTSEAARNQGGLESGPTSIFNRSPSASVLKKQAEALTAPISSTALTVIDTRDESEDVLEKILSSKMPLTNAEETQKLRKLQYVDHSTIQYRKIQKNFYMASPDVKAMTSEELKKWITELDGAKMKNAGDIRPVRSWTGAGLPSQLLSALLENGFKEPFAVQSLGCAALMSGRDLLVTAKTGSGKTLAYALPLIRHCMDQERCKANQGPIGLILVPTQELALQVFQVLAGLCKSVALKLVASYGSSSLSDNIKHVKAGSDVMVCTPGRLLDLLTVNKGKLLSFQRVSFVVIDEADRLFDGGFMEHVTAFLRNIRPDRQLAVISATMPRILKKAVLEHLDSPVEITVGGKPTPASNVEQRFYFFDEAIYELDDTKRQENKKFKKLLQVLGDEGGTGEYLILIFTDLKEECDELFAALSVNGYRNRLAVLYSGMDPLDREYALENYAPQKQYILCATGVAERGLDIPYLELVINYTLPNHYEAYVHRIGRTGRAGKKGKAISFYTRGRDDDLSPDLCEGLERANQQVPEELYDRATLIREKRKSGDAVYNSGFLRGYRNVKKQRFTSRSQKEELKAAAEAAGLAGYLSSSSGTDSDRESDEDPDIVAVNADSEGNYRDSHNTTALVTHSSGFSSSALVVSKAQENRIAKALDYAKNTSVDTTLEENQDTRFQLEYLINDLPEFVRHKIQNASFLRSVAENSGTTIIRKGIYFNPALKRTHKLKEGERPLYLLIIGKTTEAVRDARRQLDKLKTEIMDRKVKSTSALNVQF